jgi:GT2 family glycosyltransferase
LDFESPSAVADVAVVIPSWNGRRSLDKCLRALGRQLLRPDEIVVVDNGSEDGSAEFVQTHFPHVRVVRLAGNVGFAIASNTGAAVSTAKYLAFLNNDTEPEPTWLRELVACLARHPRAAAVTSKLLQSCGEGVIDDAGDALSVYGRAYQRGQGEVDRGQYDDEEQVFSASGAASLWRRNVIEALSGFDEDFFAYYEDVDLGFRARLAGWEIWYSPRAVVFHARAVTASPNWGEFAYFFSVRNRLSMLVKDMPTRLLIENAHKIAAAELITLARSSMHGHLPRTLRAWAAVTRALPRLLRERAGVQSRRRISDHELRRYLDPRYPRVSSAARNRSRQLASAR